VYKDGIVCRATLHNGLSFDCRVPCFGPALSPACNARLTDGDNNPWRVPPLKYHYSFADVQEARTVLIPRGKSVCVIYVDQLDSPRPARLKPAAAGKPARPSEFYYAIARYSGAYTADLGKEVTIYLTGRGKAPVEWKDVPIPASTRPGLVQDQKKASGQPATPPPSAPRPTWICGSLGTRVILRLAEDDPWEWVAFAAADWPCAADTWRVGLGANWFPGVSALGAFSAGLDLSQSVLRFGADLRLSWFLTQEWWVTLHFDLLRWRPRVSFFNKQLWGLRKDSACSEEFFLQKPLQPPGRCCWFHSVRRRSGGSGG
jgi:hypothetical protein